MILLTRRAAPSGQGRFALAGAVVDAATNEDLRVVWLALEMLTAAIARAAAAQAACPQMVAGPARVATGGRIPGGSGATPRPFEMIAFAFTALC